MCGLALREWTITLGPYGGMLLATGHICEIPSPKGKQGVDG
tara:strand:+ start:1519 stop:1641 length:123 start_codon:yes stop_codon:yes gene_type:complete